MTAEKAGLRKRVYPDLLRHSDAIERLKQTGNPKALQLSFRAPDMRYLSTLQQEPRGGNPYLFRACIVRFPTSRLNLSLSSQGLGQPILPP